MEVSDFDFDLPEDRIALAPARPRDSARLLHVRADGWTDRIVRDLPSLLRPGDVLVINDTKVIPAQLSGTRPVRAGGEAIAIDATLLKRQTPEDSVGAVWTAFVRPAKRLKAGDDIAFGEGFRARVEARDGAEARLRFNCAGADFDAALARHGKPPLPPYIARRRAPTATDSADYQTIYARAGASVAAPTAGLHFTGDLLAALEACGVSRVAITLHVGAGTFLPVTAEDSRDHKMHPEWGEVTKAQAEHINAARARGGRIVAVGTTSLRLLESAARTDGSIAPFRAETSIFITPGYEFRAVDLLLTNFHLPRSTLFMLVSAFCGLERMKAAYAHAVEAGYRFYSFGDACLLEPAR
jgi:S-adenosylmethionine:tRNA ribosyltransferase-isomerase